MDLASYGLGDAEEEFSDDGKGDARSPVESPRRSYAFCSDENLEQCTVYVNQELSSLGFRPIPLSMGGSDDKHAVAVTSSRGQARKHCVLLVNSIYELLQQHRHDITLLQQKDSKLQRLASEISIIRTSQFHLREQVEATEREAASCTERERQCSVINKSLNSQIKTLKEELRYAKSDHQHRIGQLNHENRKIERELARLKEKLAQSTQRAGGQSSQLGVLNNLERSDRKRASWSKATAAHEVDLYQKIVVQHETRQQELISENAELREMLTGMQQEIASVLRLRHIPIMPESAASSTADAEPMDTSISSRGSSSMGAESPEKQTPHLPHAGFLQAMEESLLNHWQVLKRELANVSSPVKTPVSRLSSSNAASSNPVTPRGVEMEALRKKMSNYEVLLAEKERELQTQLDMRLESDAKRHRGLSASKVAEARDRLEADRMLVTEQRRQLDDERELLLHVAQEMDRKRDEMNREMARPLDSALQQAHEFLDSSIFAQSRTASPPLSSPPQPIAPFGTPSTPTKTTATAMRAPDTPQNESFLNGRTPAKSLKAARAYRSIRRTPHNRSALNVSFAAEASLLASGSFVQDDHADASQSHHHEVMMMSSNSRSAHGTTGSALATSTPHHSQFQDVFHSSHGGSLTSSPRRARSRHSAGVRDTPPPPFYAGGGGGVDADPMQQSSCSPSRQLGAFVNDSF
eukprot:scpid40693/ scgid3348/ Afadin- and alpha-actinin-binding protein; Afadin DIL domain-interacting protein